MRVATAFVLVVVLLTSSGWIPATQTALASEAEVQETPTPLVSSGVTSYTLAAPKVFWHTGVPQCPPALQSPGEVPQATQYPETIKRIATYGSTVRDLYSELRDCSQGQIASNIAADDDYIYWLTSTGLMKLSTDANPGDAPQLMNALVQSPGEVVDGGDRVYLINNNTGGSNTKISYVLKSNHQRVPLSTPGNYASNLSADGEYIYYVVAGNLIRLKPGVDSGVSLTTGVSGYYAEGQRLSFCTINPFQCYYSKNVYVGKGRSVYIYSNNTGTLGSAIYTSIDTTAAVYEMVTDFNRLFFFERRTIPCSPQPCFSSYSFVLHRATRGGSSPEALYTFGPTLFPGPANLNTDGQFLFWQEDGKVQRLPNDAAALPQVNMYVTGMEVTQGIQNLSNGVLLVKNRRTFVRVYVKSVGTAVSGVTAHLYTPTLDEGPLLPVNPAGTHLTVRTNPNRDDIDQSFLFELPWKWTQENSLTLQVVLNPYKVPLEPNYGDNNGSVSVNFNPSPSLSVEFFRLNYTLNNTTYRPRITEDVLKTYSWIMRAYPLGGAIGENFKPRLWDVEGGTGLGSLVNQSHPICIFIYPDPDDDRALCASYVTNGWLWYYRFATMFGTLNVGLKTNAFYYGMISDASNNFPRGQAMYSLTSVGPSGTPGQFFTLGQGWDTDGSYADWYAAHEIGHSLGRAHPNAGSDDPATKNVAENCRHSRSDPNFPYGNTSTSRAPIGPADGSMEGFDVGDPTFGIAPAVLPSSIWNDVMSYCNSQWLSDYTYTGIYNYMISHPSLAMGADSPQSTSVSGDFLAIAGLIDPVGNTAGFSFIRRLNEATSIPPLVPGDYEIRLLNAQNSVLANYAFTPGAMTEGIGLSFAQVVDFVSGTRKVQIARTIDSQVLASQAVSANPPVVSNVALQGASSPVSGVVTLGWSASDPDGDSLTFDVAYSRDNGASFQPVKFSINGMSTQIDTAALGGSGQAVLRVTASDGVNSGYADSAPFTMANKPPEPYILTPADNTQVHYGQLVNFNGMAFDVQDGTVAGSGLVWKDDQGTTLGTGALLSLDDLPVGVNEITLQATNSVGGSATTSVTVIVDDDLDLPGPTLTAGPSMVNWHVPAGTTQVQTADVSVNNAGSGNLDWTASSNQAWLAVNPGSGTVMAGDDPATLTLSAVPGGLLANSTHVAQVTITKPASGNVPEQTIVIPVSLSIGDVWTVHTQAPMMDLYLPIVVSK